MDDFALKSEREFVVVLFQVPEGESLDAKFILDMNGGYGTFAYGTTEGSGSGAANYGLERVQRTFGRSFTADKLKKAYITSDGMLQYLLRVYKTDGNTGNIYGFKSVTNCCNIAEIIIKAPLLETFDVGNLFLTLPMLRFVTLIDGTGKRNVFIRF